MRFCVTFVVLFLSAATVWAAEDEPAGDLEKIQGKWTQRFTDPLGNRNLLSEEFVGQKMVFSVTNAEGKIVLVREMRFELQKTEHVRIITFSDVVTLLGPKDAEKRSNKKNAYVYRISGDQMIHVQGFMNGDGPRWALHIWVRSPKKTADTRSRNNDDLKK